MSLKQTSVWTLLAAVSAVLLLAGGARWMTPSVLSAPVGDSGWTARSRAWFKPRGFQGFERDPVSGADFSWTGPRTRLVLANLDRSQAYRLILDVNAFRPGAVLNPALNVLVDGVVAATVPMTVARQPVAVDLPVQRRTGATVALVSDTFVPAGDARALGVIVNNVRLEPASGHFHPSWALNAWLALAVIGCVGGVLLCGVPAAISAMLATALVAGLVWLLLLDAAFLGDDVIRLVEIGAAVALLGLVVAVIRMRWPRPRVLPEWPVAVGIVLGISALKLAFFTHPQIALTDAMFQVHRAELVHRGGYFFTSVTPSPSFEFPYAILLYLVAQPFWSWFPSEFDLANLLRGLALVADALVGLALYAIARRHWQRGPVALCCAALWTLSRAPAMALGHANLTNLFGQSLFGLALACLVWMASPGKRVLWAIVAGVLLTLGFLSHFSTLTTGLLLVSATAAAWIIVGPRSSRLIGLATVGVMVLAAVVAYGAYYSHFNDLYVRTFSRIVSGVDQQSDTSMVASPRTKWQRWITEDQFSNDYGLPGLALFIGAIVGAGYLLCLRPREPMTIALLAWAVVWLGTTALGIMTSVEVRANLAGTPMFVCLAAYGLSALAERRPWGSAVAVAGVSAVAWQGIQVWLMWLGQG